MGDPYTLLTINIIQELPFNILILKLARKVSCPGLAVRVADTSRGYTHVVCIKHYADIICMQDTLHLFADLNGEAFLHLGAFREVLNYAVNLRQTDDLSGGKVGHMCFAIDRNKMVFAMGVESDVFLHKHLIIVILVFEKASMRPVLWIQPTEHFLHIHLGHASWSAIKTVIGEIQAQDGHDLPEMLFYLLNLFVIIDFECVWSERSVCRRGYMVVLIVLFQGFKRPDIQRNFFLSHTM